MGISAPTSVPITINRKLAASPRKTTNPPHLHTVSSPLQVFVKKGGNYAHSVALRRTFLHTTRRREPPRHRFASTSPSPSSPPSLENTTSIAPKKAQDALGTASAVAMLAGTYASNVLSPPGTCLSGLRTHHHHTLSLYPADNIIFFDIPAYQRPIKYNLAV
jgi:hypothetical protein